MSKDNLSKQDKVFIKEIVETGNQTLAAKKAYGITDQSYAGKKGCIQVRKGNIQQAIKSIADSIPDELLIEKHLALLNKEEVITKNNVTSGEIDVLETGQIDVQAVSKGLEMAYKLKGSFAPEKQDITFLVPDKQSIEKANEAINSFLSKDNI